MANNELSGPTVVTFLAKWLLSIKKPRFSYRIIFIPETIGSISYLSLNHEQMKKRFLLDSMFLVSEMIGHIPTYLLEMVIL